MLKKQKFRPTLEKDTNPVIAFYLTLENDRVILHGVENGNDRKILRVSGHDGCLYKYNDCDLPSLKVSDEGRISSHPTSCSQDGQPRMGFDNSIFKRRVQ